MKKWLSNEAMNHRYIFIRGFLDISFDYLLNALVVIVINFALFSYRFVFLGIQSLAFSLSDKNRHTENGDSDGGDRVQTVHGFVQQ